MSENAVNERLIRAAEKAYKAKEEFDKAMRTLKIEGVPGYAKQYAKMVTAYSEGDAAAAAALEKKVLGSRGAGLSDGEKAELLDRQADAWTRMSCLYTEKYGAKSKGNALYSFADEAQLLTEDANGNKKLNIRAEGVMDKLEEMTGLPRKTLKRYNENIRKKKSVGGEILSWVLTLGGVIVFVLLMRTFLFEPIRVDGTSMTNTLPDNAIVFSGKLDYVFGEIKRGDVVICHYPNRESPMFGFLPIMEPTRFVKRVVGVPGDTVEIRYVHGEMVAHWALMVNGEEYATPRNAATRIASQSDWLYENGEATTDEVYRVRKVRADGAITEIPEYTGYGYTLKEDEYFVIGDNRGPSHDSRGADVGPITRDMITGKVRFIMWPLSEIQSVKNEAVVLESSTIESATPQ